MKKNSLILIVLGLLLLISLVEAITLTGLKAKLNDLPSGSVKISNQPSHTSSGSPSGGGNTVASTIDELPGMVGGC